MEAEVGGEIDEVNKKVERGERKGKLESKQRIKSRWGDFRDPMEKAWLGGEPTFEY